MKKNNRGIALVTVLIAIAFIAIISSISICAAMVNLRMKVVEKKTQKVFYTCEEAADQIFAKLGQESMDCLEDAYKITMSRLVISETTPGSDSDDPNWTNISINTQSSPVAGLTKADYELRKEYIKNICTNIGCNAAAYNPVSGTNSWSSDDTLKLLNQWIGVDITNDAVRNAISAGTYTAGPYVKSVADHCSYRPAESGDSSVWIFELKDVKIEQVTTEGFVSDITFDINIKLPLETVNYVAGSSTVNNVNTVNDYSLVADTGIVFENDKISTVNGNVYAGAQGIRTRSNGSATFVGDYVHTKGDVVLDNGSSMNFTGSTSLWCKNINIPKTDATGVLNYGSKLYLSGRTFVANDLAINGTGAEVTVSGLYNGYGNKGIVDDSTNPDQSSAILVNGSYSSLALKTSYIYLAGRSYVSFDREGMAAGTNEPYRLGESVSFKGDQEAYLVPPSQVKTTSGAPAGNPCRTAAGVDLSAAVDVDALKSYLTTEFFAKDLLDPSNPYIEKKVSVDGTSGSDIEHFIYLNFKDKDSPVTYISQLLMDETSFRALYAAVPSVNITDALEQKNYMYHLIEANILDLNQQNNSGFMVSPTNQIYSSGAVVQARMNGAHSVELGASALSSPTAVDRAMICNDLTNRFTALNEALDMIPYVLESVSWGTGGVPDTFSGLTGKNVNYRTLTSSGTTASRLVDTALMDTIGNKEYGTGDYRVVVSNSGYTFNGAFKGGVIVCKGGAVNVNADFDGLIINADTGAAMGANHGYIYINNNANISNTVTTSDLIESIAGSLDSGDATNLTALFGGTHSDAVTGGADSVTVSIEQLRHSDLVFFNDWKKTEY